MAVSVVIPTKNSARTLEACLQSIRTQAYQPIEIVVADNGSTDATKEIAERLADSVIGAGPERSAQRNAAARHAQGSCLVFIDSDMVLEENVVGECVEAVSAHADAVVIPERSFGDGFWARCKALERSCYVGDETIEAARFFTRTIFERVDGYDEQLTGSEDWDLHERAREAGAGFGRTNAFIWHDEGRLRLRHLAAKKFAYGKTLAPYARRHPRLARTQFRLVRPAYLRNRRRLAEDPIAAAGMLVMKSSEMAAGAAGLLSARLR